MNQVENLITQHLDIWTQATEAKSTAGRGTRGKINLLGIQKLRELILEMAVRGLLVPQDPNDEPASDLLKKIAAEKAQLIKDGKIKKTKPLPEITDDEKPFELPKGWEWAYLPNVCFYNVGKTPSTKNSAFWTESPDGFPWISIADLNHDSTVQATSKKITIEAVDKVFKSEPASKGSILMSFKLTVGKVSILEMDAYHNEAIISINCFKGFNNKYLFKVLPERANSGNSKRAIMGYTLNSSSLSALLIPVPPTEEQARIVAKVDELMALCDALETQTLDSIATHQTLVETLLGNLVNPDNSADSHQAWLLIEQHFDVLFTTEHSIDTLKQTILQLAVMGKLVPQDPNDEPASELLKKIATEKAQLIKNGKIKKSKPLPPITEDEKPFDLPNGWKWVRLGNCGIGFTGKTPSTKNAAFFNGDVPFIGPGQITPYKELLDAEKFLTEVGVNESVEALPNDILMVCIGGSIGKSIKVEKRLSFNQQINSIRPIMLDANYLDFSLSSDSFQEALLEKATGSATPIINRGKWEELIVSLPPKQEQTRIVAKVNQLMTLCDQIKTQLQTAQHTQAQLAQSITQEALQ
ncbi:MAG: restriction endonuclease subunit S [Methyloprofundus sp.]|nr:restriction endonuclease subunit S [Methyloprofundus sp.]